MMIVMTIMQTKGEDTDYVKDSYCNNLGVRILKLQKQKKQRE
jgi:hypothetical protein